MAEPHILSIPASGFIIEILDVTSVNLTDNRPNVSWVVSREQGAGLINYGRLRSEGEPINLLQNGILIEDHLRQMLIKTLCGHYRNLGTFYDLRLLNFVLPTITKPLGRDKVLRDETRFFMRAIGKNPMMFSLGSGFFVRHIVPSETLGPLDVKVNVDTGETMPTVQLVLQCPLEAHTLKRLQFRSEILYQAEFLFNWFSQYVPVVAVSCEALIEESFYHETIRYGIEDL